MLTIVISNASAANLLQIDSFVDDMSAIALTVVDTAHGASSNPSVVCTGTGANNGTLSDHLGAALTNGSTGIKLASAIAGTSGSCTITAYVTSTVDGAHVNTIPANAVANPANFGSPSASATLTANAQLTVTKTRSVANVAPGQWTEFSIAINNYSGGAVTGVNFTDILPKNGANQMTLFDPGTGFYTVDAGCSGGTFTGTDASGVTTGAAPTATDAGLQWTGGTVVGGVGSAPGVCTVKIRAQLPAGAATGLTFTNNIPIGSITGTGGAGGVSNTNSSSANVVSISSGAVTKAFAPASIAQGGTSTLTVTIFNRTVTALTGVDLTDNLPAGLTLAANPAATNTCGGSLEAFPGNNRLKLTGGTVAARPVASQESTCVITAKVTGTAFGSHTNTITPADFSNTQSVALPADVTANLNITTGLSATKSFSPTSVSSGGTARVKITLSNLSNGLLTNVTVNDSTFAGGLKVGNPANAATSCAGSPSMTVNPGATSAQLFGVNLASGASCDFSFDVVTSGSGPWSNTIPIGNITSAEGLSNTAAVTANLTAVANNLSLNKSFNPVLVTGGVPSVLQLDISNPSASAITGVSVTDTFPVGIEVFPVPAASTTCPGGTVTAVPGDGKLTLSGATIPASSTCRVYVTTTSVKFLNLTNTIPASAITSAQGYTNPVGTSASLSTLQGLGIMKGFSPAYIGPGQTSRLKMRLVSTYDPNANTPVVLTGVSYTDSLPAGLVVAATPNASTDCTSGTMTANAGSNLVTLSGASIQPGSNCRIEVDVTAAALGAYNNTIPVSSVTTNQGVTNQTAANATLNVVTSPTISKAFANATRNPGQANALTVTVTNNSAVDLTGVALVDTLPTGLSIASTPNASTTCSNGAVVANSGSNTLSLSGGSITAGANCTFRADVVGNSAGSYINNINASTLATDQGLSNPGAVNATMTVGNAPTVSKAFNPVAITAGGVSTLTITLGNSNAASITLGAAALVDALPANVTVASTPNVSKTCPGAVTAVAGSTSVSYASGAAIPAGGCTISLDVTSTTAGTVTNTIAAGQLQTSAGNNQLPASASLAVGGSGLVPPTVAKGFSPATISVGDTSTLTITLGNPNASSLTLAALFTDTLPAGVVVANTPAIGGTCSAANVTAVAAGNTVTFANGATIPAGGCTVTIAVTSSTGGSYTNTISASALQTDGGNNLQAATAGLVVVSPVPPTVSKSFSPGTINPGGTSRLTITLGNANAGALTLSSLFTDTLPANVSIAATPNIGGSCANGSIATGANTVTYANGATIPSGGCTIQVDVTSSTSGGPYTNVIAVGALTTTTAGSNGASATANLLVNPAQPPSVSKSFSPTTIGVGGTSTLTISLGNGNAAATTLSSDLTDTLPANLVVAAVPNIRVGGACTLAKVVAAAGASSVVYQSGGAIPSGGCSISVDVTSNTALTSYTNSIATNALVTGIGNNAVGTSATLTVLNLPTLTKSFSVPSILAGNVATLTLTLGNTNAVALTLSQALTDTFPASSLASLAGTLVVANPATIGGTCIATNPGKVTAVAGAGSISYASGATIPAGGCTITVPVTSSLGGVFANNIPAGGLKTTTGNNPAAANASLTVLAAPSVLKSFAPASIYVDTTSTLTISLGNNNAGSATLTADLVDTLPPGVTIAAGGTAGGSCTLAKVSLTTNTVTYQNTATIPAGGCTITVPVTASNAACYVNTIAAAALKTDAGNNAQPASSTLCASVVPPKLPTIGKGFSDSSIQDGASTTLTISLGNLNGFPINLTQPLVDTLPQGMTIASPLAVGGTCSGAVSAVAGGNFLSYASGASIPVGGCNITVKVSSEKEGSYTNTIAANALQTSAGANVDPASATLVVTAGPKGALSGFVYVDTNDNGLMDSGEAGIPNIRVTISGTTAAGSDLCSTRPSCVVTTDASGAFSFTGLPSGTYKLVETQTDVNQIVDASNKPLYTDGKETAGAAGGVVENNYFGSQVAYNTIDTIVLDKSVFDANGGNVRGYLFGERLRPSSNLVLKPPIVSGYVWMDRKHDRSRPPMVYEGQEGWTATLTASNGTVICKVSEVIGRQPQIAPKKHAAGALWQGGKRRRGRPEEQWCILPAG